MMKGRITISVCPASTGLGVHEGREAVMEFRGWEAGMREPWRVDWMRVSHSECCNLTRDPTRDLTRDLTNVLEYTIISNEAHSTFLQ